MAKLKFKPFIREEYTVKERRIIKLLAILLIPSLILNMVIIAKCLKLF